MSARRAAIRRERLQRNKIEKKKGKIGNLERAKEQGIIDGRAMAASVCLEVLYSKYKFSNNKAQQLMNVSCKESARFDNPGVRFVLEYYAEKFTKKINAIKEYQEIKDIETQVYCISRDDLYITSVAIILTSLNELWDFSSNKKILAGLIISWSTALIVIWKYSLIPKKTRHSIILNVCLKKLVIN